MAGIYLHIPFCKTKCHYCNFFSLASTKNKDEFLKSLHHEIESKSKVCSEKIQSIYFGGGTPSILQADEIRQLMQKIRANYEIDNLAEITLEANPEDITTSNATSWKQFGINRLSIGIQSLNDDLLLKLNRSHSAQQSTKAVKLAKDIGFDNLSVDFIFGIPDQNTNLLEEDLNRMVNLGVDHISAYNLTLEDKTALQLFIKNKKYPELSEEQGIEQFYKVEKLLEGSGFEHYETSNYAREKKYAVHNTNYWNGSSYFGFGPSAHSFYANKRSWNISSLAGYSRQISDNKLYHEFEEIDRANAFNEFIMLSLRTMWGIDLEVIKEKFNEYSEEFLRQVDKEISFGNLVKVENRIKLSNKGKILLDGISASFFV